MAKKTSQSNQAKPKPSTPRGKFRFLRQDNIGAAGAEEDQAFLAHCFVDTGDLEELLDMNSPKRIILGRTGSGKTALILRLAEEDSRVIKIKPESLALTALANSRILNFVIQLGINLDVFFKLLWRHIFAVEILKTHFHITSENEKKSFLEKIRNFFSDNKESREMQELMAFLESWGKSYWKETEFRVKEIATTFESELKATLATTLDPFAINAEYIGLLSTEQKQEAIDRVQHVLNEVHAKKLSEMIKKVGMVLEKSQANYYITIDRLDEGWVDDKLRYLLIRALIETVREFQRAKHVKIIIALRYDLLDRVIRHTRDASGFQEEKYESLYLHLEWTRDRLIEVLDRRINYLTKKRNHKIIITHKDVLPPKIGKRSGVNFIISRTLMRPRDIIHFFNLCISQAINKSRITIAMVRQAEGEYSRTRLRFLFDEWKANFPNLEKTVDLLKKREAVFSLNAITFPECEEFCLKLSFDDDCPEDQIKKAARKTINGLMGETEFRRDLVQFFYLVGLVGLKLETFERTSWSFGGRRTISEAEITPDTRVFIHPCFYRTLGIQDNESA